MQKTHFYFLFLILSFNFLSAQEKCNYRGMVLDSLQFPIYDASISAFDENNKSAGFTFSDKEGEFKLEMDCGKNYEIEIEHVNYEPLLRKITLNKNMREEIILQNSSIKLQDIVAQGRIPIKVKGDTIEYDADSFKTGSEETLEDILKKLPGIQVEDGKVFYQGKEIRSIKVEGREIFGGNTKLLTKNLPSDAVDKIQLNKKFKANPFANSMQDEEQPELNIVLKEDKKNLIFGNVSLGGDADKHYDLQEKLFRFSPKTDATLISDFNTYGKTVFSNEDYFQFLGGISEFMEEGGSNALRSSMSNVMFGSGQKATSMSNHLGAFHFGYEPIKKMNITAFALATDNNLNYESSTERIYSNFTQRDEKTNNQDIFSFISRLKLDYTINSKSNLKYRINFNEQNQDNISDINSFMNDDTEASIFRKTKQQRDNTNVSQRLSYIRKVGKDDNFGVYLTHSHQKESPELQLTATEEPFAGFFEFTPINDLYSLNENQKLVSNTFQGLAIYNHLITNLSNIRIKLGLNKNDQKLNNSLYNNDQLIQNEFTPTQMEFDFTELYADATYTRKINKFKFDLGAGIHKFKTENVGTQTHSSLDLTRVLPHFNGEYNFNNASSLRLSYEHTYEIPQIKELTEAYDIQGYFDIYRGSADLREARYQKLNLSYNIFNYFKFFNLWTSLSYSKKTDNIRTEGFFADQIQFSTPFNSETPENTWSYSLYASKRFNKVYTLKVNGSLSFADFESRNNNIKLENKSNFYSGTVTNTFKFRKKFELDAGLNYVRNDYSNQLTENDFVNWKPFLKTAWMLSDAILLQADYDFNNQFSNGEKINENHDLGLSIRYKPARKIYTYLTAGNLLDNNKIVSNSFNDFYTSINTRNTLGRYFIVSVRYKF